MISQDNLTQYLTNTNFRKIVLPSSNKFTQNDYYTVKKQEMDTAIEQLTHLDKLTNIGAVINNFQEDLTHKYKDLMKADNRVNTSTYREGTTDLTKAKRIDYDTYLSYNENEMIPAPSFITNILARNGIVGGNDSSRPKIMLYGNKNPESYFKSILVLGAPDFMIKSKYERTADICRVKKEVAFAVQNLFHANKYNLLGNGNAGRLGFNKDKMVKNLLNLENYTDTPTFQVCTDFLKKNIIIFDIAKKCFQLYIAGPVDKLLTGAVDLVPHLRTLDWNIIVMYNGAYLPVFCVDTHHLFKGEHIINTLMTEYEWLNPELYVNAKCRVLGSNSENIVPQVSNNVTVCTGIESSVPKGKPTATGLDFSVSGMHEGEVIIKRPGPVEVMPEPDISTVIESKPATEPTNTEVNAIANEELKPLAVYLLNDLQNMADIHGIPIKKQGAKGTFKNKTKQELYDELAAKLKPSSS
jgi:hypothetical protein